MKELKLPPHAEELSEKEVRRRLREEIDGLLHNDGLPKYVYYAIRDVMVASDLDVQGYIKLRYDLGEIKWHDDKRLALTKPRLHSTKK